MFTALNFCCKLLLKKLGTILTEQQSNALQNRFFFLKNESEITEISYTKSAKLASLTRLFH